MIRPVIGRLLGLAACAAAFALVVAAPVQAQSTGMVRGTVKDAQGQPVDGATVRIDMSSGTARHFETKSNKKGEFVQIGLPPGDYKVVAEKDKAASNEAGGRVSISRPLDVMLVIGAGGPSKEVAAKAAELKKTFEDGVTASRAGNHDEAIKNFEAALAISDKCFDCYYNIGYSYSQKKDYDKAEEAYKKAVELKPDYSEAYNGLANVYNAERKFDLAAEASKKAMDSTPGLAGGAGNPDAMFNQGVILWNAGKIADAKKQFEAVVAANPNHAEAHYQLGMALVNEGNLAGAAEQFSKYLELAPSGPNAATAKSLLAQLKK